MKNLMSLLFLMHAVCVLGQHDADSLIVDRTLEGVHRKTMCTVDTLVSLHSNKSLVIADSVYGSYTYSDGAKSYLEVRLRSTVCSCRDCSFADHLSIDVSNMKPGEKYKLTSSNTTWMHWNSLMMVHFETNFTGTLTYLGDDQFVLEVLKFLPAQPGVTYDGIRVVGR